MIQLLKYQIDAESVPFSKCCNSPVYIELYESGTGRIMCNEKLCQMNLLTEFVINFEEGQNLWKENLVFTTNQQQDTLVRRQVSKLITTGYYRHKSIVKEVRKLQKSTTNKPQQYSDYYPIQTDNNQEQNFQQTSNNQYNPFLTAQEDVFQAHYSQKPYGFNQSNVQPEFQDYQFQSGEQNNTYQNDQSQSRKIIPQYNQQLHFNKNVQQMNINNGENAPLKPKLKIDQGELISLNQKIASGLVQNSQVFNKEFKFNNNNNAVTQNKWRPQSTSSMETKEFRFRNTTQNQIPKIRLKSGFNKERKNKSQIGRQIQILNADDFEKQQEEERTLLDIKNMINDILQ